EQEGRVRETRVARDAAERLRADVAEAEVPVAVNARVVVGLRVVEVYGAHARESDVRVERVECGRKAVLGTQVVAGREGVRRVEADAEVQSGAARSDLAQVLEAMADALALARGVLQKYSEVAKL